MFFRLAYQLFRCDLVSIDARGEDHASMHLESLPSGSCQGSAIVYIKIVVPFTLEILYIWEDSEPEWVQPPDSSDRGRRHP